MAERLRIYELVPPQEGVVFDHNPETVKLKREQSDGAPSKGAGAKAGGGSGLGTAGSLGAMFHGTDPLTITLGKARLLGRDCKDNVETLLGWLSPVSGLKGGLVSLALSQLGIAPSKPPDLVVQWGSGLSIAATLTSADISYIRVADDGTPLHAVCNLTLKESPIPLPFTNPTSGGRPGRHRHIVLVDETLMSIASGAYGNPGAWRAIAEVNGVDDPTAVRPGDCLVPAGTGRTERRWGRDERPCPADGRRAGDGTHQTGRLDALEPDGRRTSRTDGRGHEPAAPRHVRADLPRS